MDGATSTVSAVVTGSPDTVMIPAGGSGAAHITDTYGSAPGSLLITKTIAGPVAGHQGPVTIHVVCDGIGLSPDFVVAAGTPAGNVTKSFDGIPAGSVCTVTETADGATATVTATVSGNNQTVTVPAGKVVSVNLMDVYQQTPGLAPRYRAHLAESDQDHRWTGRPAARSHRDPGGLWRPAPRVRLPDPGPPVPALCRAITPISRPDPAAPSPRLQTATPVPWLWRRPANARR